jgi:replicative DNA helicase
LEELVANGVEQGVELVVVDYLQYLARSMTLEEVGKMSKELKSLALTYKVPIIVITQIRKGDRMRKWTEVEIDDIMGTSAIGYDCDIALLTSRHDPENNYTQDGFHVKILKNRNRGFDIDKQYCTLGWDRTKIYTPDARGTAQHLFPK